jgi:hypothetical protein
MVQLDFKKTQVKAMMIMLCQWDFDEEIEK